MSYKFREEGIKILAYYFFDNDQYENVDQNKIKIDKIKRENQKYSYLLH